MSSAAALGPYSRVSALSCKGIELEFRGHDARSLDKYHQALAAARAVGVEDCLVTAILTVEVADREFFALMRRSREPSVTAMNRPSVAAELRKWAEAVTGAAAVARRRRSAGATQPAEHAWYVAHYVADECARGDLDSNALEYAKRVASIGPETTVLAASVTLHILQNATQFALFSASELSSRLSATCDLVDEAVALAGPYRVKDTFSSLEVQLKERLRISVEVWRQQRSTATHAARLAEALKQLYHHGAFKAGEQTLAVHEMEEKNAKMNAARSAASAPELLRCCALASCGAMEAHVSHFSKCAACKTVVYCSKDCQLADWPAHKKACKAARKAAEAAANTAGNAAA